MLRSGGLRDTARRLVRRPEGSRVARAVMAALARARRAGAPSARVLLPPGPGDAPRPRAPAAGHGSLRRSFSDRSADDSELEAAGKAPPRRFLKAGGERAPGGGGKQPPGSAGPRAQAAPGGASHARSSSALQKVAQLESRFLRRKKQLESRERRQEPPEEPVSSASSREHGASGSKYRRNCTRENGALGGAGSGRSRPGDAAVKQQLGPGGEGEERKEPVRSCGQLSGRNQDWRVPVSDSERMGKTETPVASGMPPASQEEISLSKTPRAPSFRSKDSEKSLFLGANSLTPSPTNRNLLVLNNERSQSLAPSRKDNVVRSILPRTGHVKQSHVSLGSDGSEIKSLDELFSEATEAEDSASGSSNDFRVNILSLDDLASDIPHETQELKWEGVGFQNVQKSDRDPPKAVSQVKNDQTSIKTSAVAGMNDASEEDIEKIMTETEISEHLSEVSAAFPGYRQNDVDDDGTLHSEYSEDFEESPSVSDSDLVSEPSEGHAHGHPWSGEDPSSASSPSSTRETRDQAPRATVKETAVQTLDSPFTYYWPETNNSAVLGPSLGNSYVDPVPVASHVISMDAVEALTAYSPSVLVLNDMLKQHLLLTQQFVENIHQLHRSLVASLEMEQFHYHTLQEAKEYIEKHKSPPLTLEQALQELEKGQEQKLL